jgi:hypothetical protein
MVLEEGINNLGKKECIIGSFGNRKHIDGHYKRVLQWQFLGYGIGMGLKQEAFFSY